MVLGGAKVLFSRMLVLFTLYDTAIPESARRRDAGAMGR